MNTTPTTAPTDDPTARAWKRGNIIAVTIMAALAVTIATATATNSTPSPQHGEKTLSCSGRGPYSGTFIDASISRAGDDLIVAWIAPATMFDNPTANDTWLWNVDLTDRSATWTHRWDAGTLTESVTGTGTKGTGQRTSNGVHSVILPGWGARARSGGVSFAAATRSPDGGTVGCSWDASR